MEIVDAHHHLWDVATREHPWMDGPWADPLRAAFTPALLGAVARPRGVVATVVVQAVSAVEETRELLAVAADPDNLVAGVVGWVDLTAPSVADDLAALQAVPGGDRLVAIRHQVQDEPDPDWLLRPDVERGLRAVTAAGLAYDLLVKPPQLPAAVKIVERLPDARFVLDHLAKPDIAHGRWEPWAGDLVALARHDNVTAKVSGLVTEADWATWRPEQLVGYVHHALDCFGPDRLMFGSDWPVCTLAASYDEVTATADGLLAHLNPTERAEVFANTARRAYHLR
jgi:L-fuconolactonase